MALCRGRERVDAVINVVEQPEPPDFDPKVCRPGHKWLKNRGIDPNSERPPGVDLNHIGGDALIKLIKSISIKLYVLPYTLNVAQEAEQSIILLPNLK